MEVAPGIHRIETVVWDRLLCVHALRGDDTVLVDPGTNRTPYDVTFPYLTEIGAAPAGVRMVVDTHCHADHAGGNATALSQAPNAVVVAHSRDARWIASPSIQLRESYVEAMKPYGWTSPPDYVARVASMMGPDAPVHRSVDTAIEVSVGGDWSVQVIPAPGHTRGSLVVFDPRSGTLIAGDAVTGTGDRFVDGRPRGAAHYVDAAYRSSLEQIRSLGAAVLLTTHFPVVRGAAVRAFVEESLMHFTRCEEATAAAVRAAGRPVSLLPVAAAVRERLGGYGTPMSWYPPIRAHLEDLTARGLLRRTTVENVYAWEPA
ncbi:MAG: MBL fold metallo-hydrolase [Chloroflexi bacterium]|nr:MBL fold metallo-hydrolase [Chloroflexota bacterium]